MREGGREGGRHERRCTRVEMFSAEKANCRPGLLML